MKVMRAGPCGAIIGLVAIGTPAEASPPIAGCFNGHCDTALDIMHADVTARLVGCDPLISDPVLVNGKPPDGILWTLLEVMPAKAIPVDPVFQLAANGPPPSTYPELRLRLKPGYYGSLTVSVGDCSFGSLPLATAAASGDRHIVLVRQTEPAITSTNQNGAGGVYGYAPLPDLQITLTGGVPERTLVARDEVSRVPFAGAGGERYTYFFDAVKPGRYALTVTGYGWEKSLGEVVVTRPGEMVLRYIRAGELPFASEDR